MYASAYGVSIDEALRRLHLQVSIGDLNGQLSQNEAETFAGLWIQNSPDYRVVARFTSNGAETIKRYTANGPLQGLVEVRPANSSLKLLETEQARLMVGADQIGAEIHTSLNLVDNVVEVTVPNQALFRASIEKNAEVLPPYVRVVESNIELRPVTDIYGGLRLSSSAGDCTIGFSVRKPSTGELGVATAGHCIPPASYNGTSLTSGGYVWSGARDVGWYKASGFTPRNLVYYGSGYRTITYGRIRSLQPNGATVCKFGIASGYACGTIVDNAQDGINVRTNYLVQGGDSGGPNFTGAEAWGTTISQYRVNGQNVGTVYAPVDNESALLGVVILTQ
jgi:hypothetical protein